MTFRGLFRAFSLVSLVMALGFLVFKEIEPPRTQPLTLLDKIKGGQIHHLVDSLIQSQVWPAQWTLSTGEPLSIQYTLDTPLQHWTESFLNQKAPLFGAVAAIDARTGRILTLTSFEQGKTTTNQYVLSSSFPVASIFKIVTSAIVLERDLATPDTVYSFSGSEHSLRPRSILSPRKGGRTKTLADAFARSINPIYGDIGQHQIDPEDFQLFAQKFMIFDGQLGQISVEPGRIAPLESDEKQDISRARVASGYTRETRFSPLLAAIWASAIVNQGSVMRPYVVEKIFYQNQPIFQDTPTLLKTMMSSGAAEKLKEMMVGTVLSGTARKTFRRWVRQKKDVITGGKTGSLMSEKGKCDWFVGYAQDFTKSIAIAVLLVHDEYRTVKASEVAREYFSRSFED